MRSFSKIALIPIAFVFSVVFVVGTSAQGPKNEIFKRMEAHAKALSSVKAAITISEHESTLDDYDVKRGTVYYIPGKGKDLTMKLDITDPFKEILVVLRGNYVFYQPRIKQAYVGKTSDTSKKDKGTGAFDFMNMSKAELNANFATQYLGIEKVGGKEMWRLHLTPKRKRSYKHADLWVDGNGMPVQTRITEMNDDSTTYLLGNIQKNVTIPGRTFKITLPKGTKRIKG